MFVDTIKTEKFAVALSALLGFALVALAIPVCKGDECFIKKAPSVEEMKKTTFKLNSKCYQFRPETVSCPNDKDKIVDAFTNAVARAQE